MNTTLHISLHTAPLVGGGGAPRGPNIGSGDPVGIDGPRGKNLEEVEFDFPLQKTLVH